jgi:hypothetical protein
MLMMISACSDLSVLVNTSVMFINRGMDSIHLEEVESQAYTFSL